MVVTVAGVREIGWGSEACCPVGLGGRKKGREGGAGCSDRRREGV